MAIRLPHRLSTPGTQASPSMAFKTEPSSPIQSSFQSRPHQSPGNDLDDNDMDDPLALVSQRSVSRSSPAVGISVASRAAAQNAMASGSGGGGPQIGKASPNLSSKSRRPVSSSNPVITHPNVPPSSVAQARQSNRNLTPVRPHPLTQTPPPPPLHADISTWAHLGLIQENASLSSQLTETRSELARLSETHRELEEAHETLQAKAERSQTESRNLHANEERLLDALRKQKEITSFLMRQVKDGVTRRYDAEEDRDGWKRAYQELRAGLGEVWEGVLERERERVGGSGSTAAFGGTRARGKDGERAVGTEDDDDDDEEMDGQEDIVAVQEGMGNVPGPTSGSGSNPRSAQSKRRAKPNINPHLTRSSPTNGSTHKRPSPSASASTPIKPSYPISSARKISSASTRKARSRVARTAEDEMDLTVVGAGPLDRGEGAVGVRENENAVASGSGGGSGSGSGSKRRRISKTKSVTIATADMEKERYMDGHVSGERGVEDELDLDSMIYSNHAAALHAGLDPDELHLPYPDVGKREGNVNGSEREVESRGADDRQRSGRTPERRRIRPLAYWKGETT